MITVQLKKRINHHLPKGTRGVISKNDFATFGVGDNTETPWKVKVFINNVETRILNTDLEIADDNSNDKTNHPAGQEKQLALL